jgi:hypothetical protein
METPEVKTTPALWLEQKKNLPERFTVDDMETSN